MIFKLLLAGTLSLAITPGAYAQRVDLQAFSPANGSPQPFALRVTGSAIGEKQPKTDDFSGLVDDFAAFGSEKSLAQAGHLEELVDFGGVTADSSAEA